MNSGFHRLLYASIGPWVFGLILILPPDLTAQSPASAQKPGQPAALDRGRQLHQEGQLLAAERAYRAFLATSPTAMDAASAHNNLCLIYLSRGENQAALEDCQAAVGLRRTPVESLPRPLARGLNNLALVLLNLGRPADAEPLLREALQLNRGLGDAFATVQNLGNLGTLSIDTGDFGRAMDLFQEAQTLATEHREEPWAAEQIAVSRANQGVVLEHLGAFRQALDLYEPVVAASDIDSSRQAYLRLNIAVLYRNLGDPVRAVRELEMARAAFRDLKDTSGESNAWLNLGLAYQLNLERPDEAEEAYRKVLELAGQGHQRRDEIDAYGSLGRLLLEQERWEDSRKALQRGLDLALKSDDPEGSWACQEGLGRLALARGDLTEAARLLEQAITTIEGQRNRLEAGLLRAGYFGGRRSAYQGAVTAYARRALAGDGNAAARALEIVQQAKARELLENLTPGAALPRPLTAEEIGAAAGDAFVLELFVADATLYAWSILPAGLRLQDLGPSKPVLEGAAIVHRRLSRGSMREGEDPLEEALDHLSSRLLAPLDATAWASKRWMISGDHVLRYLPFEILPTADGSLLLEKVTLSYLPSASSLAWLRRDRPSPSVVFAGFASPLWRPRSPGTALQARLLLRDFDPRPLPAAEAEMVRSATSLGGRHSLHVGDAATEEAFRRAVQEGARVVHLATHAVVRESITSGAAIVLSPAGEDDGLLRPEEIASFDARVDLTVLAACSTALGTAEDSRALASLTGSLLAAGSRSVLATLWDVGDQPTAAFMEQLYFRLGKGMTPAEALRQTKLQFLHQAEWKDPSLWSAYVLQGDPPAIVPTRRWPLWLLSLLAGLPALWFAVRALQRNRSAQM